MSIISVVIPVYNEEECLSELLSRLRSVANDVERHRFEFVLIENGSSDNSWELIRGACDTDSRFKGIKLSRNFGMDGALSAGLHFTNGDCCVMMAADLQDEPELIPQMIEKWEAGFESVAVKVTARRKSSLIRRLNSAAFYWIANRLTNGLIPRNISDFRLVDRKVYEVVRDMTERNQFMRGIFAWVGFKTTEIRAERPERFAGESKASFRVVLRLARRGILSFSDTPLRLISIFGIFSSLIAGISIPIFIALRIVIGAPFQGFLTLVVILLVVFSALSLMIGIVAEYVALLLTETKRRPNFIVSDTRQN